MIMEVVIKSVGNAYKTSMVNGEIAKDVNGRPVLVVDKISHYFVLLVLLLALLRMMLVIMRLDKNPSYLYLMW